MRDEQENTSTRDQPGKTRTWWHPLLVRLLQHELTDSYDVQEEVSIGKIPLRVDVVLIRQEDDELSQAHAEVLPALVERLNRYTLIEFKSPVDKLERGDLDYLFGCAHLYRAQHPQRIPSGDLSLIVLAPAITDAVRQDIRSSNWTLTEVENGIFRIEEPLFTTWVIETDQFASAGGEPILALFSRVFLKNRRDIMQRLMDAGHGAVLYYVLQQIQQFQAAGEQFMIQHTDIEQMVDVAEDLRLAVLSSMTPEQRLQGLAPEQRLQGLAPEEILQGLSPEQAGRLLRLLTDKQAESDSEQE